MTSLQHATACVADDDALHEHAMQRPQAYRLCVCVCNMHAGSVFVPGASVLTAQQLQVCRIAMSDNSNIPMLAFTSSYSIEQTNNSCRHLQADLSRFETAGSRHVRCQPPLSAPVAAAAQPNQQYLCNNNNNNDNHNSDLCYDMRFRTSSQELKLLVALYRAKVSYCQYYSSIVCRPWVGGQVHTLSP